MHSYHGVNVKTLKSEKQIRFSFGISRSNWELVAHCFFCGRAGVFILIF